MICPYSGRNAGYRGTTGTLASMQEPDLVTRVALSAGVSTGEAARIVADVIAYYHEPTPAYVRRRHASLQTRGMKNPEIFMQISAELSHRVVAPPELSERQLRRIVYG